jgi:exonuclease III
MILHEIKAFCRGSYTYFSKQKNKDTGHSTDHNGFRLDYIFCSRPLKDKIKDVKIDHNPRKANLSDHAIIYADFDLSRE